MTDDKFSWVETINNYHISSTQKRILKVNCLNYLNLLE